MSPVRGEEKEVMDKGTRYGRSFEMKKEGGTSSRTAERERYAYIYIYI